MSYLFSLASHAVVDIARRAILALASAGAAGKASRSASSRKIASRRSPRFRTGYPAPAYSTLILRAIPRPYPTPNDMSISRTDPFTSGRPGRDFAG